MRHMPTWRNAIVDQREAMVLQWLSGRYSAADVAARFETSRPTVYAWAARYRADGRAGLVDRPPVAQRCPHKTAPDIEAAILAARRRYGWGPRKLRIKLLAHDPAVAWPQPSTIGEILRRHDLVSMSRRRRVATAAPFRQKYPATAAGTVMTIDFKGQFKLRNGQYCYPLTMMDRVSRYLLACEALPSTAYPATWRAVEQVFRTHGLPDAVQSDNGVPFVAARSLARVSRFSVQLMKLDIQPVINDPGHPEQNGAHERFHATLAQATTRPPARHHRAQQRCFDRFQQTYNHERPHEALGQTVPAAHFAGGRRPFPSRPLVREYPAHYEVRRVSDRGTIKFRNQRWFLSDALSGEEVALAPVDDHIWALRFGRFELARVDERDGRWV